MTQVVKSMWSAGCIFLYFSTIFIEVVAFYWQFWGGGTINSKRRVIGVGGSSVG